MSKHTPGPIDVHRYDNEGGGISFQLQARSGEILGYANEDHGHERGVAAQEAKANAELWAAAPEMLLALDKARPALARAAFDGAPLTSKDLEACAKALAAVDAALALVRGKR